MPGCGDEVLGRRVPVDAVPAGDHGTDQRDLQDRAKARLEERGGLARRELGRADRTVTSAGADRCGTGRPEVVNPVHFAERREHELSTALLEDRDRGGPELSRPAPRDGQEDVRAHGNADPQRASDQRIEATDDGRYGVPRGD